MRILNLVDYFISILNQYFYYLLLWIRVKIRIMWNLSASTLFFNLIKNEQSSFEISIMFPFRNWKSWANKFWKLNREKEIVRSCSYSGRQTNKFIFSKNSFCRTTKPSTSALRIWPLRPSSNIQSSSKKEWLRINSTLSLKEKLASGLAIVPSSMIPPLLTTKRNRRKRGRKEIVLKLFR